MKNFIWVVSCALVLTACASKPEVVEEPKGDRQTTVTFSLVSDDNVNPNLLGDAAPLEIQVFELEDDSMFMSADYDQLKKDQKSTLRSNYVTSYDYVLTPGQFKFVDAFEVSEETNYIGVMAHFSDPEISDWKKAVKVLNKNRQYHLLMKFSEYQVQLDKVE
ncbi:type VI secretion system-associated lipoprotein [Vibrio ponticus]|uniref:Type VI secretion system lipoprotein TssJ n=1 Tax=Vibrio ponticus TaxID=265668 RepID=A0A3N3DZE1_9VIBR|nr:type VI secretion system lipoprotein TssJ [Vibrio ponticus]OLQ84318.1 type VI secretion system-associated lipoprotein [Vibrio ponticus]ROV59762.1 type VI secretion system lipoprotein TssJ [Vibrio ponticus]